MGYSPWGHKKLDMIERLSRSLSIGKGHGGGFSICKIAQSFSSVQFSHSVVSDFLRHHGLQHTRPRCLSPTPRVYSNSCPLSW